MSPELRPNKAEKLFLNLAYERFFLLFDEVMNEEFWEKEAWYRFSRVSHAFSVYTEVIAYEPFKYIFESLKIKRPPMESEIANELFKFVRNILSHFPFYETWEDVWISKELVNWQREGLSIDRFLKKYNGKDKVKYRFWEEEKKLMTYLSICFPEKYEDNKIYLKDIITEKEGVKFSFIMMRQVLNTQLE